MQHRNPESFYTQRENGVVVAYACIFPVNYTWLERVLKDEIRMGDVPVEEIYPFVADTPSGIYIRDLIVDQQIGQEKAKHYGQRILAELINVITRLGAKGVNIRAFYALATSPDGNRLAKKLGFRAMRSWTTRLLVMCPRRYWLKRRVRRSSMTTKLSSNAISIKRKLTVKLIVLANAY